MRKIIIEPTQTIYVGEPSKNNSVCLEKVVGVFEDKRGGNIYLLLSISLVDNISENEQLFISKQLHRIVKPYIMRYAFCSSKTLIRETRKRTKTNNSPKTDWSKVVEAIHALPIPKKKSIRSNIPKSVIDNIKHPYHGGGCSGK